MSGNSLRVSKEFSKVMGKENPREWNSDAGSIYQAAVVERVDNFIKQINFYPANKLY